MPKKRIITARITIIMAKAFALYHFIKQLSPDSLELYCRHENVGNFRYSPDSDADHIQQFIAFFNQLPEETQNRIEADFQQINELTPNASLHMLITECQKQDIEVPDEVVDQLDEYDRALWFYLNQRRVFNKVSLEYEFQDKRGWKDMYVRSIPVSELTDPDADRLAQALRGYLITNELKGRRCIVEYYTKNNRAYFVAYPEDYTQADLQYVGDDRLIKQQPRKPVFQIFFIYNPEYGRLSVKAKGGWQKAKLLQQIFAKAVLGYEYDVESDWVFDLNRLKDPEFEFSIRPEDQIVSVKVKSMQLNFYNGHRRITIDATDSAKTGMEDIRDAIEQHQIPLDQVNIHHVSIEIKFHPNRDIKYDRGQITVHLGHPNSHDLSNQPRANKARELLQRWELEERTNDAGIIEES